MPSGLDYLAAALCTTPEFRQHGMQLNADQSLSADLAALLLRSLGMAAVVLRLPRDRQPEGGVEWGVVERLLAALSSILLQPGLANHTAALDDASLLRLLRSAATVLDLLPSPASLGDLRRSQDAGKLVARVTEKVLHRGLEEQAAVALLPLLPCLTRLLQLGTRLDFAEARPAVSWGLQLGSWEPIACSLMEAGKAAELPGGAAAAPAWCAAGAEACRLLPLLAAAAPHVADYGASPVVPVLVHELLAAASAAATAAMLYAQQDSAPSAELASASTTLLEASCRAVHWSVAAPSVAAVVLQFEEQPVVTLLLLLCDSFDGAAEQLESGLLGGR